MTVSTEIQIAEFAGSHGDLLSSAEKNYLVKKITEWEKYRSAAPRLQEAAEWVRVEDFRKAILLIQAMASRFRNNGKGFLKGEYLIKSADEMVEKHKELTQTRPAQTKQ